MTKFSEIADLKVGSRQVKKSILSNTTIFQAKENGLVFHLDFSNTDCYSGSGIDIYDLTGNFEVNAITTPSYNSADNSYLGQLEIITPDHNKGLYPLNGSMTLRFEIMSSINSFQEIWSGNAVDNETGTNSGIYIKIRYSHVLHIWVSNDNGVVNYKAFNNNTVSASFKFLTVVLDKSNLEIRTYIGNNLINSSFLNNMDAPINGNLYENIRLFGGKSYPSSLRYKKVKIYNRALTPDEFID